MTAPKHVVNAQQASNSTVCSSTSDQETVLSTSRPQQRARSPPRRVRHLGVAAVEMIVGAPKTLHPWHAVASIRLVGLSRRCRLRFDIAGFLDAHSHNAQASKSERPAPLHALTLCTALICVTRWLRVKYHSQ